VMSFARIEQGV